MAVLTVRNLPDEVHRALRMRAAEHGRSMEAEVRSILESTVKPARQTGFGSMMVDLVQRAGVTDEDSAALEAEVTARRKDTVHEPLPLG